MRQYANWCDRHPKRFFYGTGASDCPECVQSRMPRKPTIYEALRAKLGREPTNDEITIECRRIISEANRELAEQGKLPNQRKRK